MHGVKRLLREPKELREVKGIAWHGTDPSAANIFVLSPKLVRRAGNGVRDNDECLRTGLPL